MEINESIIRKNNELIEQGLEGAKERSEERKFINKLLDGAKYDRDRIIGEIKYFYQRTAEDIFEVGKRLLILKAKESHGKFMEAIDKKIKMSPRTAQRFMAIAVKFSNAPTLAHLGSCKLDAIISVPDEEIEKLENEGILFNKFTMAELGSMSVRELRKEVGEFKRKYQKEETRNEKLETELEQTKAELEKIKEKFSGTPTDKKIREIHNEIYDLMRHQEVLFRQAEVFIQNGLAEGTCSESMIEDHRSLTTLIYKNSILEWNRARDWGAPDNELVDTPEEADAMDIDGIYAKAPEVAQLHDYVLERAGEPEE